GGERERHLRAMEDATSSPGGPRAASSATIEPARSDHRQRHKGQDAALARRKARGAAMHLIVRSNPDNPPGAIRALRLVGAPTPSLEGTEEAECGDLLAQSRKEGPIFFRPSATRLNATRCLTIE